MAIHSAVLGAAGSWCGHSRLFLPWLPESEQIKESSSTLDVVIGQENTFGLITYTWSIDGEPQNGAMVVTGKKDGEDVGSARSLTAGWTDSWHQNSFVMHLTDRDEPSPYLKLSGEYSGGEGPNWGWRIELEMKAEETLSFRMVNIDPNGFEEWAVDAVYHRA